MEPVAYIRRSARSRSDPGDLSREFQIEKVRQLANGDGPTLRIIDADWGRSASTDKTDKRTAFLGLLEAVERGEVSAVYAYATDRLARSVEWSARLLNACRRAGVPIVTGEGRFEPGDAMTNQLFYFQAMQNEGYSSQASEKRRATVAKQRERGDKLGPVFYGSLPGEDIAAVLAAFDEAGSAHAAARLLNERGVPTRRGGAWTHSTVRQILAREGRVPRLGTKGAKPKAPFALYRLVRCHCGRTMTPVVHKYGNGHQRTILRCVSSTADPNHGPKTIAERLILPAIKAEADRLRIPADALEADADEQDVAALERKRSLVIDAFVDGVIDKPERDRRLLVIDGEHDVLVARRSAHATVAAIPNRIDWSWTPEALNAVLRGLWERIELGADMTPTAFVWRVPEWRS